jgi:hypothetical protein
MLWSMHNPVKSGVYLALGFTYYILSVYCLRHTFRICAFQAQRIPTTTTTPVLRGFITSPNTPKPQSKGWAPLFYPLLILGATVRGTFIVTVALDVQDPLPLIIVINSFPSLFLFSAYLIVMLSWAELYHSAERLRKINLRLVYFAFNFVLYSVITGLYIAEFSQPGEDVRDRMINNYFLQAAWYIISCTYFVFSIGFLVYAFLLSKLLHMALFVTKYDMLKQINYFTFLVVFVFLIRCGVALTEASNQLPESGPWWVVEPIYYAVLEVIPLVFMVQIFQMHRTKQQLPSQSSSSPLLPASVSHISATVPMPAYRPVV